jgi:hypothetical protein
MVEINKNKALSQDEWKALVDYNPDTGVFVWKVNRYRTQAGDIAGYRKPNGYISIRTNKKHHPCHRIAWIITYGVDTDGFIDHINGDKSDNRIVNLRVANKSANGFNTTKRANNTSGYKGVTWHKQIGKWAARAKVNYECYHLGLFDDVLEAAKAYDDFAKANHGEFYKDNL